MTWWNRFRRRVRLDEDLDKELRFNVDQYTDDLVASGHSHQQARRKARLALGGTEQLKEECRDARGTRWLEDLWHDFRYALRALSQRPGFAAVALLMLALGTGANTVMFTLINSVLLKPLAYPEPEKLVTLGVGTAEFGGDLVSYPDYLDLRRDTMRSRTSRPGATTAAAQSLNRVSLHGSWGGKFRRICSACWGFPLSRGEASCPIRIGGAERRCPSSAIVCGSGVSEKAQQRLARALFWTASRAPSSALPPPAFNSVRTRMSLRRSARTRLRG
jgi:hypothetical protein